MIQAQPISAWPLSAKAIIARSINTLQRQEDSPLPEPIFSANFLSGALPPGLTYTNSSTVRTYFGADGLLKTASANEPIFEYDPVTRALLGMRWEMEQRTNLATNSEGAAATWTVSNVTDAGTPIAGFSASLAFGDNSADRTAFKSISFTVSTAYTLSVFVVMDDESAPSLGLSSTTGDFSIVQAGTVILTGAPSVTRISGPLYRVSAARVASSTATQTIGIRKYTGQSEKGFRVIGIQVEAAVSASSYIPTTSAAVTRQPDVLTATSISPWYRQDEGTIVFEGVASTPATAQRGIYLLSDGTDGERISAYRASGLNGGVLVVDGGVTQADISTLSSIAQFSIFRHALAYKLNDVAGSVNNGTPVVDASATMPTITALTLGHGNTAGTQAFMGYARRFSYYPRRLPDAQLQGLSRV